MASTAELVVKVLADTSSAHASFSSMGGALTAALGVGAAGGAAVAVLQAASDYQSAMATVQQAYNTMDFAPGTDRYESAKNQMVKVSTELATSFKDVSDVQSQAARFVDDFGNKLPVDKVNEYTDTMIRLSKVSTDNLAATDIGQRIDVFEKLTGKDNFAGTGSAVSALSGVHNQGEAPMLDTAIAIAQYGADLGVSQAQALGIGNFLTDLKAGGQMGGASIGRMLLRMDTSADEVLDPVTKFAAVKQKRDATEKLGDLQEELAEAEAKRSEMFGQHGLKTEYRQHPSEVMAADARIAKLQREIGDQAEDITHLDDPNRSRPRGQMNLAEMAKTAGMDPTAMAELFKANPMEALLSYTRGLSQLPAGERGAAETLAGIVNVRDQKTVNALAAADRPAVADEYVRLAQAQLDQPTDLKSRSDIRLGTAESHLKDLDAAIFGKSAEAGGPALAVVDTKMQEATNAIQNTPWDELKDKITGTVGGFDLLNNVLNAPGVAGVLGGLGLALPALLGKAGGAIGGAVGATGGLGAALVPAAAASILANGLLDPNVGVIGRALAGKPFLIDPNERPTPREPSPFAINIDVNAGVQSAEQAFDAVKAKFLAAFAAAASGTPVAGAIAGAYTSHHQ